MRAFGGYGKRNAGRSISPLDRDDVAFVHRPPDQRNNSYFFRQISIAHSYF